MVVPFNGTLGGSAVAYNGSNTMPWLVSPPSCGVITPLWPLSMIVAAGEFVGAALALCADDNYVHYNDYVAADSLVR